MGAKDQYRALSRQVAKAFRDIKCILATRPVFLQRDEIIRGHVCCSFLALVLRKELDKRLRNFGIALKGVISNRI